MNKRTVMAVGVVIGWAAREKLVGPWTASEYKLARKIQVAEDLSLKYKNQRDVALHAVSEWRDWHDMLLDTRSGVYTERLRVQMKDWLVEYADAAPEGRMRTLNREAINVISTEFSTRLVKLVLKEPEGATTTE